jgi:hypothetical protein
VAEGFGTSGEFFRVTGAAKERKVGHHLEFSIGVGRRNFGRVSGGNFRFDFGIRIFRHGFTALNQEHTIFFEVPWTIF